jgi:hypothetical protein
MSNWSEARRQHAPLRRAADEDVEGAKALWMATRGEGDPEIDSFVEAVLDLAPVEHASLLAEGATANSYAISCLWKHWWPAQKATPLQRRDKAREGWAEFSERAELAEEIRYGLGFDRSDAWETTRDVNARRGPSIEKVRRIAEIAGRMFAALRAAKAERVTSAPEEVYSVEMGANLTRLLPSELAHLGQCTEVVLLDNLANQKAMQFAMRGQGPAGKGPLVIALDESGSMHALRQEWSKGAAIALTRMAHQDDRKVVIVHYSTSIRTRVIEPGDAKGIMDMIAHWFGNGTYIAPALEESALQVAKLASERDRGADVILVTDGLDHHTNDELNASIDAIEAQGARLYTVAIECAIDEGNPMRARAERYVPIGGAELAEGSVGAMKDAVI